MAKETIKARIQLKNDTEENWNKAINFVPLQGEIIIYSADNSHPFSRIKVGDGITTVIKLPFVNADGINGSTIYADSMINWEANPLFIPKKGDIIIFFDKTKIIKDGSEIEIPGFKIGDGKAYNIDLPFVGDDIIEQLLAHINDTSKHVTEKEREYWNNKISCEDTIVDETLILLRGDLNA